MAVTLSDAHYVINSYGTFDSVHDELQNAIDRADFISQPARTFRGRGCLRSSGNQGCTSSLTSKTVPV